MTIIVDGVAGSVTAGEGAETVEITLTPRDEADLPAGATDNGDGSFTITVPVEADGSFSTGVTPKDGTDVSAEAVDAAGNHSTPTIEVGVDTTAPDNSSTTIVIDDLTADNVINSEEAAGNVAITGTVTGDFTAGDRVTVTVNKVASTGTVNADGTFSIEVAGSDLAADTNANVSIEATDTAGNTGTVTQDKSYSVDTEAPSAPTIDSVNEDGVAGSVTAGEGAETVEITLTPRDEADLPAGATDNGDGSFTITVPVEADGSFSTGVTPKDGTDVSAEAVDAAGNHSTPTIEVGVDTTAPDNSSTTIVIDDLTADNLYERLRNSAISRR